MNWINYHSSKKTITVDIPPQRDSGVRSALSKKIYALRPLIHDFVMRVKKKLMKNLNYSTRRMTGIGLRTGLSILLFIGLLGSPTIILKAQTTVQIGTGTSVSSSTLYSPIYRFSATSTTTGGRSLIIYTASEMAAAGINVGDVITKVSFNKPSLGSFNSPISYTMRMGNSSLTPPLSTATPNWTTIYSTETIVLSSTSFNIPNAAGWMEFDLTTPFTYTGGTLEISTDQDMTGIGSTNNIAWEYTPGFDTYIIGEGIGSNTNLSAYMQRPNIKITYQPGGPCTVPPTAGTATSSVTAPICAGQSVQLGLTGNSTGTGQTYQWQSGTSSTGPWVNFGASSSSAAMSVSPATSTYYRAAVTCTGQTSYSAAIQVQVNPLFPGGTYTINPTGTGPNNFPSFGAAVGALSCGISGSVVFNVAPGYTFNEQVTLPASIGATATNTVTFNGNGDTLTNNGTSTMPWTVGLDGADHITFNNLVIVGTNASYALTVHLWDGADSNHFNGCNIRTPPNTSTTGHVPFSISGSPTAGTGGTGDFGNGNVIDSCTIFGGYYNTVFYGSSSNPPVGNKVLNSKLEDFYLYGSYNYYQNGVEISGNQISRPTRTTVSTFYGIYLSTGNTNALIEKNRLSNQFGGAPTNTGAAYNIYVSSTSATAGNEIKIFNNVVGNITGNGTVYGIYLPSAVNVQAYNNTISMDNTNATAGTIYGINSTGTSGVDVKNNIVSVTQGGTGTKYCLYFSGAGKTSDHNDLYMGSTGGSSNNIGYYSGAINTLTAWQSANGGIWDQTSVAMDPMFADPTNGDFTPVNAALDNLGTPLASVTDDILGNTRSATTPDIGAYEFSVPACSGTVTAGTVDNAPTMSVCAGDPFDLHVTGQTAPASGQTYQWQQRDPNGTSGWQSITGANGPGYSMANGITAATDFRFYIVCTNSNTSDTSSVLSVTLNPANQCYCIPPPPSITGLYWIESFSTTGAIANISNLNTGQTLPSGYADYTADTIKVAPAGSFSFNLQAQSGSSPGVSIWIDWNQDGLFDQSELAYDDNGGSSSSLNTYTSTISVPATALPGNTRLRIRNYTNRTPCGLQSYGEAEDYTVAIVSLATCTGQPNAGGIDTGSFNICDGIPFSLSDTGFTISGGMTYQWQQKSGTGSWQDISGANSNFLAVSNGISISTQYRFYAVCSNSSLADTSAEITVTINAANQCYCTPPAPSIGGLYWIQSFSTTNGLSNISNLNTGASANGYADYTSDTVKVNIGGTFNFNLQAQSGASPGVKMWIDWDQSGTFDNNEVVYSSTAGSTSALNTYTDSITAPLTAIPGTTRMRIRNYTNITPCGAQSYGEAEDYTVELMPLGNCATTSLPSNITSTINQDTLCPTGGDVNLNIDTTLALSGLTFQWQKSANGTTGWTNIGTAQTLPTITDANVTANTWYRCQILCGGTLDVTTSIVSVFISNPGLGTVPSDQDVCGTGSVTLNATATGGSSVHWYDADAGGNLLGTGNSYTNVFSQTDTVWVAAGTGGGGTPQSLLTTTAAGNSAYGNLFDIDVTNPIRIDSFSINAMTPGTQVGIYYRVGTGVGFNTDTTGWTLLGTATINNIGSPLSVIPFFVNLTLSPGTYSFALSASTTVNYSNGTALGNVVVSDANVAIKEGYGGSSQYPSFGFTNQPRVWNGSLYYSLAGCETPRQPIVINVHDSVPVNLGNDTTICEGTTLTLDAGTPGSTYQWNTGATTQTLGVTAAGDYSVQVIAPWGCEGSDSIHVDVTPLPHVDDITAVHNGDDSYTFTANNVVGAVNYNWDFGDGQGFSSSAHPTYLYGAYGDYTVTLIVSNNCGSDTTQLIVHYTPSGIGNVDPGKNQLKLYPNPAKDIVTLKNESSQKMQTIEVYNVLGQRVFRGDAQGSESYQLHVDGYASGMYSVKIFFEDGTWAQRKFEIAK